MTIVGGFKNIEQKCRINIASVAMASQHPTSTTITLHGVLLSVTNPTNTILVDRNKGFPRGAQYFQTPGNRNSMGSQPMLQGLHLLESESG